MATNRVREMGRYVNGACTKPDEPNSGDPCHIGSIPGVAVEDEDSTGNTVIDTKGVYNLEVNAVNGSGNSAVAVGDILYYLDADVAEVPISKKDTGVRFGYALKAITSGSKATIPVKIGY